MKVSELRREIEALKIQNAELLSRQAEIEVYESRIDDLEDTAEKQAETIAELRKYIGDGSVTIVKQRRLLWEKEKVISCLVSMFCEDASGE